VPSEQLFSKAGDGITSERNNLKPELAEACVLLNQEY